MSSKKMPRGCLWTHQLLLLLYTFPCPKTSLSKPTKFYQNQFCKQHLQRSRTLRRLVGGALIPAVSFPGRCSLSTDQDVSPCWAGQCPNLSFHQAALRKIASCPSSSLPPGTNCLVILWCYEGLGAIGPITFSLSATLCINLLTPAQSRCQDPSWPLPWSHHFSCYFLLMSGCLAKLQS